MKDKLGVAKFGGTSVANMLDEVKQKSPNFDYVVVSAPGKRNDNDSKLTIDLGSANPNVDSIMDRFSLFGASSNTLSEIQEELKRRLNRNNPSEILAFGEWASAKALSDSMGQEAKFIDAKDSIICDDLGEVKLFHTPEESFNGTYIVPGFYYSQNGEIHTFDKGGSDKTGAIIARDKKLNYYNFTDSAMKQADPRLIENPGTISELTYEELRHLTKAGFEIIHPDVWKIMEKGRKILTIMGTSDDLLTSDKTQIMNRRIISPNESPYMGLGLIKSVTSIFVDNSKDLEFMDLKLEMRLKNLNLPKITATGGLGGTTYFFEDLTSGQYNQIVTSFKEVGKIRGDYKQLCGIVLVGSGMRGRRGTLVEIINSTDESINAICQDATENNIIAFVPETPGLEAYRRVYDKLF